MKHLELGTTKSSRDKLGLTHLSLLNMGLNHTYLEQLNTLCRNI